MLDFDKFKTAIAKQFDVLAQHNLFRVGVDGETMWTQYLQAYPEGSNPIYRERTQHDCNCCRGFIRSIGNAVAIIDGKIVTIWDVTVGEPEYQSVADAMAKLVRQYSIRDIYVHRDHSAGTDKNFEHRTDGSKVKPWTHFYVRFPRRNTGRELYCEGVQIASVLGEYRSLHDVLLRSLTELGKDATETVLELIAQNSLY